MNSLTGPHWPRRPRRGERRGWPAWLGPWPRLTIAGAAFIIIGLIGVWEGERPFWDPLPTMKHNIQPTFEPGEPGLVVFEALQIRAKEKVEITGASWKDVPAGLTIERLLLVEAGDMDRALRPLEENVRTARPLVGSTISRKDSGRYAVAAVLRADADGVYRLEGLTMKVRVDGRREWTVDMRYLVTLSVF